MGWDYPLPASGISKIVNAFHQGDATANLTTASTVFVDVAAQFNLTIAAVTGDVLELDFHVCWFVTNAGAADQVGFTFNIAGADKGSAFGLSGPSAAVNAGNMGTHIHYLYVVQAGDISGGTVAVKPRMVSSATAGTLTIVNNANIIPFFSCKNLLH